MLFWSETIFSSATPVSSLLASKNGFVTQSGSLSQGGPTSSPCGPLFEIVRACGPQPARNCSKSWCSLKKTSSLEISIQFSLFLCQNHGVL